MRLAVLAIALAVACGSPPPAPVEAPPVSAAPTETPVLVAPSDAPADVLPADVSALPARDVCVDRDGTLAAATVSGSLAGAYGAEAIPLAMLNWSGPSSGGCVSYPGASTRRASCGGESLPVVTHVLCQQ